MIITFQVPLDMYEHLKFYSNRSAYIRELIRADMKAHPIERLIREIAARDQVDPKTEKYLLNIIRRNNHDQST